MPVFRKWFSEVFYFRNICNLIWDFIQKMVSTENKLVPYFELHTLGKARKLLFLSCYFVHSWINISFMKSGFSSFAGAPLKEGLLKLPLSNHASVCLSVKSFVDDRPLVFFSVFFSLMMIESCKIKKLTLPIFLKNIICDKMKAIWAQNGQKLDQSPNH